MCARLKNGSIALGIVAAALAAGVWVGGKTGALTTKYYVYEYVSNNTVTKGFACKCKMVDGKPRWRGKENSNCDPETVNDSPYKINEVPVSHPVPPAHSPHGNSKTPVPNVPIPTGACCRTKPRAPDLIGVNIPNDGACL